MITTTALHTTSAAYRNTKRVTIDTADAPIMVPTHAMPSVRLTYRMLRGRGVPAWMARYTIVTAHIAGESFGRASERGLIE